MNKFTVSGQVSEVTSIENNKATFDLFSSKLGYTFTVTAYAPGNEFPFKEGDYVVVSGELLAMKGQGSYWHEIRSNRVTFAAPESDVNTIALIGRTVRETEIKYFEDDKIRSTNSLAVDNYIDGETVPSYFNITLWGKTAQVMHQYASSKGKQIGITGTFRTSTANDRIYCDITVDTVGGLTLLASAGQSATRNSNGSFGGRPKPKQKPADDDFYSEEDNSSYQEVEVPPVPEDLDSME